MIRENIKIILSPKEQGVEKILEQIQKCSDSSGQVTAKAANQDFGE